MSSTVWASPVSSSGSSVGGNISIEIQDSSSGSSSSVGSADLTIHP